ncbi:MAG TPA: type II toxin-antitoxin system HicB family antitoxin [Polyangiaceae bacterium]
MHYTARISREGKHWLAEFVDAPGCQTFATSRSELEPMATDALIGWLEAYLVTGHAPPPPRSRRVSGNVLRVVVPPGLSVAIKLRWARRAANLTQGELATRAHVSQQQIAKLERSDENPTIATLAKVAAALDVRLEVDFAS